MGPDRQHLFGQRRIGSVRPDQLRGFESRHPRFYKIARAGVTVNAIAPGYTDTDMKGAVLSEILQKIIERIPIGRLAAPVEIARCIPSLWLRTPRSSRAPRST